jgi:hypothetical protein
LSELAALETSGSLPQNVNYAVKASYALLMLESVPALTGKLKQPAASERPFQTIVNDTQAATALVTVEFPTRPSRD